MAKEWTDGRLDDLRNGVDRGFTQVDQRFDRVEGEIRSFRQETRNEFGGVRAEFSEEIGGVRSELIDVRKEINGVQRTIAFGAIAMTGAILTGFAGICALIATQL